MIKSDYVCISQKNSRLKKLPTSLMDTNSHLIGEKSQKKSNHRNLTQLGIKNAIFGGQR